MSEPKWLRKNAVAHAAVIEGLRQASNREFADPPDLRDVPHAMLDEVNRDLEQNYAAFSQAVKANTQKLTGQDVCPS